RTAGQNNLLPIGRKATFHLGLNAGVQGRVIQVASSERCDEPLRVSNYRAIENVEVRCRVIVPVGMSPPIDPNAGFVLIEDPRAGTDRVLTDLVVVDRLYGDEVDALVRSGADDQERRVRLTQRYPDGLIVRSLERLNRFVEARCVDCLRAEELPRLQKV